MAARSNGNRGVRNHYVLIVFDSCRYDSFPERPPAHHAESGESGAAMVVCSLDGALTFQPADGIDATLEPPRVVLFAFCRLKLPSGCGTSATQHCRPGTTPSPLICEVILAWALSALGVASGLKENTSNARR